ncbi:CRAL/TRIO domain protein [Paecilomyces variotii No. 5]|uniref:CRAL/TRIO domain protein n=1 Tax=Byssochlamys spectabilis (strain No. 5 / NBRC 109023) TaxID=1356009 RepID=V5GCD6_BYSSN|nr:CRAL/TRIO domain protein [Paecilomyces variotii No. 5]
MTSAIEIPPGHVGNLTIDQEKKLKQFWTVLLQSWDLNLSDADLLAPVTTGDAPKGHRRWFSLSRGQTQLSQETYPAIPPRLFDTLKGLNTGADEFNAIQAILTKLPGDELRWAYITILKQDHPDALCLRFLRAEDWNVPKGFIKFITALHWRVKEYKVDEKILARGEQYAVDESQRTDNSSGKKDAEGFVVQLHTGKGHFHGCDKLGRPICIVRVRLHDPNDQTEKALNDYVIHCIEMVRLLQVPPVETMTLVFDLTSFTLSNWDFPPVKFIIKSFQENYPESLGAMIFYKAPWIFSGLWKLIQGILDPVVAAKVHFINDARGLEKLIPREHILKELGGEEDWEYEYIDPEPHENDKHRDSTTRDTLLAERRLLGDELFETTTTWISAGQCLDRRNEIIEKLRDNYWRLDPYVRSRNILDRTGVIKKGGKIEFYPVMGQLQAGEEPKAMDVEHIETAPPVTMTA